MNALPESGTVKVKVPGSASYVKLEEAEQLCDRIAFINHGEIAAQGSVEELTSRYGVASLEDAYLELVGRKELSRSHLGEAELIEEPA